VAHDKIVINAVLDGLFAISQTEIVINSSEKGLFFGFVSDVIRVESVPELRYAGLVQENAVFCV
jgi:hypothetical protein